MSLRDPQSPGWPERGERTADEKVAAKWAAVYVAELESETKRRHLGLPKQRRLGKAIEEYLAHRRNTKELGTWASERSVLRHLLEAAGPSASLPSALDGLQDLMDSLVTRGYNPSTLRTYLQSFSGFFRWAGHTVPRVELPNPGKVDVRTLEPSEVVRLRKAARKVDKRLPGTLLAVEIGLTMGLRQGEIFALRWEAIDAQEESVRVQWQIPKGSTTPKPLKGKLARTAFILPEWWPHHRKRTGIIVDVPTRRRQWVMIKSVLETAGLDRVGAGWHLLRHQYSREFVEGRGGRFEELQIFLGHASILTTQRIYGHFKESVAVKLARERARGVS